MEVLVVLTRRAAGASLVVDQGGDAMCGSSWIELVTQLLPVLPNSDTSTQIVVFQKDGGTPGPVPTAGR